MSISATGKVGGPAGSGRAGNSRFGKVKYSASTEEQSVTGIDAANSVSVNADNSEDHESAGKQSFSSPREHNQTKENLSPGNTYISGAVEALNASGVLENASSGASRNQKLGTYNSNQNLYDSEENAELDKLYNKNYIKHLYENNEPPENIDELV